MTRTKAFAGRLTLVGIGLVVGLLLSEIVVRLMLPDGLLPTLGYDGGELEEGPVPGVAFLFRPNVPGWTNELGLIGTRVTTPRPAPDVARILVVSDSTGHMVMDEQRHPNRSWPARMEEALRKETRIPVEVLNLSAPGLSLEQELLVVEHRGLALDPDVILFGYCVNDPVPTDILSAPNLRVRFPALLSLLELREYKARQASPASWYDPSSETWHALEATFARLGRLAAQRPVLMVGLPILVDDERELTFLGSVRQLAERHGVPWIDAVGPLREVGPLSSFRSKQALADGVHFTAQGHEAFGAVVARTLAPRLDAGLARGKRPRGVAGP